MGFACFGRKQDVASKRGDSQRKPSCCVRTVDDDGNSTSENASAFYQSRLRRGLHPNDGDAHINFLSANTVTSPDREAAPRVDERMLRNTPTLDDLTRNYMANLDRLELYEEKLHDQQERARAVEARRRQLDCGSVAGGVSGSLSGRLVQREHGTGAIPSVGSANSEDLSGHSFQTSSGPSATSTRGSSTSESLWARITRGGKKRKDKLVKNILAPSASVANGGSGRPAPRYEANNGGVCNVNRAGEESNESSTDDVVRVCMDGDSTEEQRRRAQGGYYEPPAEYRSTTIAEKDPINEVEVIRLNDDFYSSQELRHWRRVQRNRAGDFLVDAESSNNISSGSIYMNPTGAGHLYGRSSPQEQYQRQQAFLSSIGTSMGEFVPRFGALHSTEDASGGVFSRGDDDTDLHLDTVMEEVEEGEADQYDIAGLDSDTRHYPGDDEAPEARNAGGACLVRLNGHGADSSSRRPTRKGDVDSDAGGGSNTVVSAAVGAGDQRGINAPPSTALNDVDTDFDEEMARMEERMRMNQEENNNNVNRGNGAPLLGNDVADDSDACMMPRLPPRLQPPLHPYTSFRGSHIDFVDSQRRLSN